MNGREYFLLFILSEKTPLLAVGMNQTLSQPKADEYAQVL